MSDRVGLAGRANGLDATNDLAPTGHESGAGLLQVRNLLARGVQDPFAIIEVIRAHPGDAQQILAFLHATVGNGGVQNVLALLRNSPPLPGGAAAHVKPSTSSATPGSGQTTGVPQPTTASAAPSPASDVAVSANDETQDAGELHLLIARRDQAGIVALLERSSHPEHMYELMRAYRGGFVPDVLSVVTTKSLRARALVYLGEQVPLEDRIRERDKGDSAAILHDLEALDAEHVLALIEGNGSRVPGATAPRWLSATTSFENLKDSLRAQLGDDDYYHAMRELLTKAERAQTARTNKAMNVPGVQMIEIDPALLNGMDLEIIGAPGLPPASQMRVELAEQRIRAADRAGSWISKPQLSSPAYLALADLEKSERAELAKKLDAAPLNNLGGTNLVRLARTADDATVIAEAVVTSQGTAMLSHEPSNEEGTNVALGRASELLQHAHAKVDALPKDAPKGERDAATAELARLEKLFLADGSDLRKSLAGERWIQSDPDSEQLASRLSTLGADPITIGADRLRGVGALDVDGLASVLRKIPKEHRLVAFERSGISAERQRFEKLTPEQRSYLSGLLWEASGKIDARMIELAPGPTKPESDTTAAKPQQAAMEIPSELVPQISFSVNATGGITLDTFDPTTEIAKHDVITAVRAHDGGRALARLARMSREQQNEIIEDAGYKAAYAALPESDDKAGLRKASVVGAVKALGDNASLASAQDHPELALEELGQRTRHYGGQAAMRRAYVMVERLGGLDAVQKHPELIDTLTLTIDERVAIGRLVDVTDKNVGADPAMLDTRESFKSAADRESANQIMFGQPQLANTPEAALDPNVEADFMYYRLHEAAGARSGPEVMDKFTSEGPTMDAAVTEFVMLYKQRKPGGFSRADLPQLADRYHRALRALDAYRAANDSFASSAAQIVGAVVATVAVSVLSGGALGPAAIAAMSGLSAGAASAATGAAIRLENTHGSIAKDFGTGAVEGGVAALASPLAARVVRGASIGMSGTRAAAHAGTNAVMHATGGLGATIASAAIEGALINSAAELFQTAVDEATWDRGIAEALARMLSAVGHGAAVGAAFGAGAIVAGAAAVAVGKLAKKLGEKTAQGLARWFEGAGAAHVLEHLSEAEQQMLGKVYQHLSAGEMAQADEALSHIQSVPGSTRKMLMESARARHAFDTVTDLGPVDFDGLNLHPRIVSEEEFKKLAKGRADAAILIEDGKPQIIVREGAPPSAIREEITHLHQWQTDATMQQRMASLDESKLAPGAWEKVPAQEKLQLHINKLEVESDAQRRILDQLAGSDAAAATNEMLDAQENLFLIDERLAELRAAQKAKSFDPHALKLDEAPRLYTKTGRSSAAPKSADAKAAQKMIGTRTVKFKNTRDELEGLGYQLHRRGSEDGGPVFRVTRAPDKMYLPHLSVDEFSGEIRAGVVGGFQERIETAGVTWQAEQRELGNLRNRLPKLEGDARELATDTLEASGPHFRKVLERKVGSQVGQMDEAAAGMLSRWGRTLEELAAKEGIAVEALADDVLNGVSFPLTEAGYDKFRHNIRSRTVKYLHQIEDGGEQMKALHEMIDAQPDSGSRGHLFTEFAKKDKAANKVLPYEEGTPKSFTGSDLNKIRTPDGAANVAKKNRLELDEGRYAVEHKTGPGAFKMDQAEDYARRAREGHGFRLTKGGQIAEYDNIAYVFSNQADAEAAMNQLSNGQLTNRLLDRNPGGFHVMFYDEQGELTRILQVVKP